MVRGDYCGRVWVLAVTNMVVLGGAAFLVYAVVAFVRSNNTGGVIGASIFLVFWVSIGSTVYCTFCSGLGVRYMAERPIAPPLNLLPLVQRPRAASVSDGSAPSHSSRHVVGDSPDHALDSLPRELPMRGKGMEPGIDPKDIIPAYKHPGGVPPDGASECAVCLSEVEEGEMVKRLPSCVHLFHHQCIDPWLRENLTCPVCRGDVVVPPPTGMV